MFKRTEELRFLTDLMGTQALAQMKVRAAARLHGELLSKMTDEELIQAHDDCLNWLNALDAFDPAVLKFSRDALAMQSLLLNRILEKNTRLLGSYALYIECPDPEAEKICAEVAGAYDLPFIQIPALKAFRGGYINLTGLAMDSKKGAEFYTLLQDDLGKTRARIHLVAASLFFKEGDKDD